MAVKSLATLIKLQKSFVDEQRQHVTRLQDHLDKIDAAITELEIFKAREQAAAENMEARATYAQFLTRMVAQGRVLQHERQSAALAVKIALDKLAELFEEQKRYEIAEAQRIETETREELRRENIELDEIGGVMHERQK